MSLAFLWIGGITLSVPCMPHRRRLLRRSARKLGRVGRIILESEFVVAHIFALGTLTIVVFA
jgi:hypothetical protein